MIEHAFRSMGGVPRSGQDRDDVVAAGAEGVDEGGVVDREAGVAPGEGRNRNGENLDRCRG